MAGPSASILLPRTLTMQEQDGVCGVLDMYALHRKGGDVWVDGRPFVVSFDEDWDDELRELDACGLPEVLGWRPAGLVGLVAMCNAARDHHLLAQWCIACCKTYSGIVDFGGPLDVASLAVAHHVGAVTKISCPDGLAGTLFVCRHQDGPGEYRTSHYGDAELLDSWRKRPGFRMVK